MTVKEAYNELIAIDRKGRSYENIVALLHWDQETQMPLRATEERAEQISLMEKLHHEVISDPRIAELLDRLGSSKNNPQGSEELPEQWRSFLRVQQYQYQQNSCLPVTLVQELAERSSLATVAWRRAREENDKAQFLPHLTRLIELNREMAEHRGYDDEIYDALLGSYEPWMKTAKVRELFSELEQQLPTIIDKLSSSKHDLSQFAKITANIPLKEQQSFHQELLTALQFDGERARLDASAHPFSITLGSHDVRITTRYNSFLSALFSVLHEYGHALYELSVSPDLYGSSLASGTSMMVHESQSRMWENYIGRSPEFWHYWYPKLLEHCPSFRALPQKDFMNCLHVVEQQAIRIEADEVSYNMHIILRFNLELGLISGDLRPQDLSEAWNSAAEQLLGITAKTDAEGFLQDIHWAHGGFGYFPTYALGNLYAAQLFSTMRKELDLADQLAAGNMGEIISWLNTRIHVHGWGRTADEIMMDVSGEELQSRYFLEYIHERYGL